jgi:hypothetical protein
MAQAVRVVTSEEISKLMHDAPQMNEIDASLAETVLSYVESNDLEGAHVYAATMSQDGLARALRNLVSALAVFAVALVKKQMMRGSDPV